MADLPPGSLNMYGSHCRDPYLQERTPCDPRGYSAEELAENRNQIKKLETEIKKMEEDRIQKEEAVEEMKKHWRESLDNIRRKLSEGFAHVLSMRGNIYPRSPSAGRVPFEGPLPAFALAAPTPASPPPTRGATAAPPTATAKQEDAAAKSTWRRGRPTDSQTLVAVKELLRVTSARRTAEILSSTKAAAQPVPASTDPLPPDQGIPLKTSASPAPPELLNKQRTGSRKRRLKINQPSAEAVQAAVKKAKKASLRLSIPIRITEEDKENVYITPVPVEEREQPRRSPEHHGDWWL